MTDLPKGWVNSSIGQLIELNPKSACADGTTVGFVPMPLLGKSYLEKIRFEAKPWSDVKRGYTHFSDGDVLLAKITPCFENGKAGLAESLPNALGAGSTEYFVCRPSPDVLTPKYLLAFFKTENFVTNGATQMTGSVGHKRVPKNYVTATAIPLAPLPEQKRIADKLDTVLARVDACRERLNRVPLILKRFRQSVLAAATSGKLTEDWRVINPSVWQTLRADEVCAKVQSGGTPKSGFIDTAGVPFLKVYNIVNQKIDFQYRPQFVSDIINSGNLSKSRALPTDVVMNIVGPPLGKVAVIPNTYPEWNINQAVTLFRPSNKIISEWIYIILCGGNNLSTILNDTKGSVGQVNISLSQCRAFEFPVPTIEEQHEIVRRVETLFAFADRLETRLAAARTATERLTPALLAKAFRGELVPQDPNDEPAAELLKRLAITREQSPKSKRGIKATN